MDLIKLFLAYICYYLGDFTERIGFWYPYQKLMIWSYILDCNKKIWQGINKE